MAQAKYITVAEWDEGTDNRVLAQLSGDAGTPGTVGESNTVLLNCIERASADVESNALRGGRYSATDLTTLQTNDDWTLKGLVADLATGYLYAGRGATMPPDTDARVREARKALDELRKGVRIFNDSASISAGQPGVSLITAGRRARLDMVSDSRFFPPARTEVY